jgi:regulator of sigma E protease
LSIVIAIIALCIIILIHELGHFGAARLFGMKVYQFNLGMGPILLKKKKGETQYALRAFPIGGSCMLGEDDEATDDPREFRNKPVWQRIIVISAGAFLNVVLGLILAIIISVALPIASLTVADFNPGSVSDTGDSALLPNDRIVSINGMRIISNPEIAYIMGTTLMRGGDETAAAMTVSIFGFNSISNTGDYGLQQGDRIVSINGTAARSAGQIFELIESAVAQTQVSGTVVIDEGEEHEVTVSYVESEFVVEREIEGEVWRITLPAVRIPVRVDGNGQRSHIRDFFVQAVYEFIVDRWYCAADCDYTTNCALASQRNRCSGTIERLTLPNVTFAAAPNERGGISFVRDFRVWAAEKSFGNIMGYSVRETVGMGRIIWLSLADILRGTYGINDLSGPVGIGGVIQEGAKHTESFGELIMMIVQISAFITINLGIVNLLPIPALDGGRIVFLTVEAIRRKPLNQNVEALIHFIGFALLILLIIFVTFNDIRQLAGCG